MIHQILFTLLILACMAGLSILHQIKVDDALGFLTDWECVSINFLIQVLLFLIGFGIYQLCN